jgi:hypothetical protein
MHQPISAARSQNEAVDLDQPDHRSSISELTYDSTDTHGPFSITSGGASIIEVIATPRLHETDKEASDEAENLIQFEPLNGAALAGYTVLETQHHSSTNALSVLGSNISPVGSITSEFEHEPKETRRFYRKWHTSWIDNWTAEILSCSLSAAACHITKGRATFDLAISAEIATS